MTDTVTIPSTRAGGGKTELGIVYINIYLFINFILLNCIYNNIKHNYLL